MPLAKLYRTVKQMRIGETAYTIPFALRFYSDNRQMLWANTPIYPEPTGSSNMPITRTEEGFVVDISDITNTWEVFNPDEFVVSQIINNPS